MTENTGISVTPAGTESVSAEGGGRMVKIWIGNIDTKLTEYQLLKIAEQFGVISSYDFLYNINDKGQRFPR
jgi:RNA recognition motif-containing protein